MWMQDLQPRIPEAYFRYVEESGGTKPEDAFGYVASLTSPQQQEFCEKCGLRYKELVHGIKGAESGREELNL